MHIRSSSIRSSSSVEIDALFAGLNETAGGGGDRVGATLAQTAALRRIEAEERCLDHAVLVRGEGAPAAAARGREVCAVLL